MDHLDIDTLAPRHIPLHSLDFAILLALADRSRHGYDIVKSIENREQHQRIYPANLYRRIRDLRAKELIDEVDPPAQSDQRRHYFELTDLGRAVATLESQRFEAVLAEAREKRLLTRPGDAQ